jgi:hypothetical protein
MPTKSSRPADHEPILDLQRIGDGRAFSRALARIIVRRELISAGAIPDPDRCDAPALAG